MFKKYDANVLVIIIIVGLIMILWGGQMHKNKLKKDIGDYDFTVGVVEVYFSRGTIGYNVGHSSITYSYIINNVRYVKYYDALFYKLPALPNVGDKYIVAYNKNDPQKSILLGDYPVKTDEDFIAYIKEGIKIDF